MILLVLHYLLAGLLILNIHVVFSASSDVCVVDVIPTADPPKNMQKIGAGITSSSDINILITVHHTISVIPKPPKKKKLTGDTVTKALLPKTIPNLELTSGKPPSTW